jgi:hypothetical protein
MTHRFLNKLLKFLSILTFTALLLISLWIAFSKLVFQSADVFSVKSIDTTKYSRDKAWEMLNNPNSDQVIKLQVSNIQKTGANYVAIGTPYDERFLPVLRKWVKAARDNNLHVWFRGNFSGWEGWFAYSRIGQTEHLNLMNQFILKNPDLFEDQDIFTPCPECENGGPGDPRQTGDVQGFRSFMLQEHQESQAGFGKLGKKVITNYSSMNYDVASLIMDKETTLEMGGVVTIDHYVKNPNQLSPDVDRLADQTGGKVILGEFGAPIPDINGEMSENQQADWINQALMTLATNRNLIGLNYWTSVGGSTAIWNDSQSPKAAVSILRKFYTLKKKVYPSL